ncbi:hypothetical protein SDC9_49080 [bioreactor metagenome]|uniref:Uncharacterized protein n=1 Tax=bioreactor metagenome TaxID=1076179 RepID=A0A644WG34_9ZZZZ
MDRRDPRFRRALDPRHQIGQMRRHRRRAEFGDIGAGDEGAPGAEQHHGLHLGIGVTGGDGLPQPLPQRL